MFLFFKRKSELIIFFFFQAEDGIRDYKVTGVQTCAFRSCRPWLARLGEEMRIAPSAQRLPSAATVGQLGQAVLAAGGGVSAEALTPLYLRPSEAELKARRG